MKRDEPVIITQQPFSKDMAVKGLSFIEKHLGLASKILPQHPLRILYLEATKHLSSGITWGPCRGFNSLALWGIRLSMVQDWAGFKQLTKRIRKDLKNWDSHLHEQVWRNFSRTLRKTPLNRDEIRYHVHGRPNKYILEYLIGKTLSSSETQRLIQEKESLYRQLCLKRPA